MASDYEKEEGVKSVNGTQGVRDAEKGEMPAQQGPTETNPEKQQVTPDAPQQVGKLEVIPRSQRRGLFARFAIIPEAANPRDYKNSTKWMMTIIVSLAAVTSSTGSSIFYPALSQVAHDLHTTATVTNLSLAFYMLAMAFTPLWWSAYSERLGRRTIYILSFSLFLVFSIISAVSVNIAMLIVFRILSGGAAASVQAVGAGTVSDLWEPKVRGKAMGIFYLGPLCGPGLAPVIGGALTQGFRWRSTLWFLSIFGGALLLMIFFLLPETLPRKDPTKSEVKPQGTDLNESGTKKPGIGIRFLKGIVQPLAVLKYLRYPPVLITVYTGSIAFAALFVVNISIQSIFEKSPYNFTDIEVGLFYLGPTIGYAISSQVGGKWIDYIMAREARKANRYDADGKLVYLPEDRMRENIWLAATLYPAGLIWYGWTADKGVYWIVPCIATAFFGIGSMLVFGAVTTMLTEFMPKKTSSGVAVNNLVRNILSCTAAVVTQPLIDAMGIGWTCTMVGLFFWVTGNATILAMRKWGPRWRVSMDKKLNQQTA